MSTATSTERYTIMAIGSAGTRRIFDNQERTWGDFVWSPGYRGTCITPEEAEQWCAERNAADAQRLTIPASQHTPTKPKWWDESKAIKDSIKAYPLTPVGEPDPDWRTFDTSFGAHMAAEAALAGDNTTHNPARINTDTLAIVGYEINGVDRSIDQTLIATGNTNMRSYLYHDLMLAIRAAKMDSPEARTVADDRLDVWRRGYVLYTIIDGIKYVYPVDKY